MTYLKIVQYMYLVFAGFFIYDAYTKALNGENYWLSVIIALVAIGMFFFRRHFYNKHQNPKR
ncbi:hypothetical protein KK2020170_03670 [Flavobacterium okayamense]|uniref:Uncharacterized protein n=1 Tax=Flavobacterium okayamense TaxID=2830782 RepID=A0ABM7S9A1_9FLAO|nr:hypothetical protein KK2020170_03670 [Flavobacterium okayamense]